MSFVNITITVFSTVDFITALSETGVFPSIWWVVCLLTLFMVVAYYYLINGVNFNSILSWVFWMGLNSLFNFIWAMYRTRQVLIREGLEFGMSEYISFSLNVAIVAAIVFSVLSFLLKHWSVNAKRTPF